LPILSYAEENSELLQDSATLDLVIERIHPLIGDRILAAWEFPQPLRRIPSEHLDFQRQPESVDYADIVQVAMLQSIAGTEHSYAREVGGRMPSSARPGPNPARDQ